MTTACDAIELLLAARFDGSLAEADATQLARHLAECVACRGLAATLAPVTDPRGDHAALPAVPAGAYAVGDEVARGGMGRIVAARDLRIGRPVAIKELLAGAAAKARFEREARVTARLQHPGIVPIYEIGAWPDGTPFYVMRMVEGRTLRQAIGATDGAADRMRLLPAVITACETIGFAHSKRVIHRDVTPSNILVGAHGETVVIDWGLAKDLAAPDDDAPGPDAAGPYRVEPERADLTRAGAVLGTAAYMPPEQARGDDVDERADVYALGALLYHLLAAAPPYQGSSAEVLDAVRAGAPPRLAKRAPQAPRDLVSIVDKAMAREPADRYAHAGELADELRRFQAGRVVEAHRYTAGERVRHWMRRHPVLSAAVLVLLIAGGVGAGLVVRERDRVDTRGREADERLAELATRNGTFWLDRGRRWRAAVYLTEAMRLGNDGAAVRFLLARAMTAIDSIELAIPPDGKVRGVAISPDGRSVLIDRPDHLDQVRVPDGAHLVGVPLPRSTSGDRANVGGLYGPHYVDDGRQIAAERWLSAGGGTDYWDASTGAFLRHEPAPEEDDATDAVDDEPDAATEPERCALSPDGARRADWHDAVVTISDAATRRPRSSFLIPWGEPDDVFFTADGARVIVDDQPNEIHLGYSASVTGPLIADTATGEVIEVLGDRAAMSIAVSDDRTRMVVVTLAAGVSVVRLDHDRGVRSFDAGARGAATLVDVEADGGAVLGAEAGGRLLLWNAGAAVELPALRAPADLSDDGSRLVAWSDTGVQVIDARTGAAVRTIAAGPAPRALGLSGDGNRVVIVTADRRAVVMDLARDAILDVATDVEAAMLSPSGGELAACRGDGPALFTLRHDLGTAEVTERYDRDQDDDEAGDAAAPTPPCALVGFPSEHGWATARWDGHTWMLRAVNVLPAPGFRDLYAASRPGSTVAQATSAEVRVAVGFALDEGGVYDSRGGETFTIDTTQPIAALAVSPDGSLIATDTGIWTQHGYELMRWERRSTEPPRVEFARDGRSLVVVDGLVVTVRDVYLEERGPEELAAIIEARTGLRYEP